MQEQSMSASVDPKHWDALMKLLNEADSSLTKRNTDRMDKSLSLFAKTVEKLGLADLLDLAGKFSLYKKSVLPGWDEEAVATMSFSLGALVEKMQMHTYGDAFSSGLSEIHEFLEVYGEEASAEPQGISDSAQAAPIPEPLPAPPAKGSERIAAAMEPRVVESEGKAKSPPSSASPEDTGPTPGETQPSREPSPEKTEPGPPDFRDLPRTPSIVQPGPLETHASEPATIAPPSPLADVTPHAEDAPPDRQLDALPGPAGDSREFLVKMLERDPGSHVFVDLAEALCREKRWSEAVEICRRGLVLHPRITRARALLGWALRESGELDESVTALQKAREELEENALVYRLLAETASSRGDAEGAARLGNLYSSLCTHGGPGSLDSHPAGDLRPFEPGEVPSGSGTVLAIQDPREKQADLLAALLRRFEGKPAAPAASRSIFPDEARNTLKRMLLSRADS
jgi:hypothetical protein